VKTSCSGNLTDHCCHLPNGGANGECKYLAKNIPNLVPPRRFSCGLFNEYRLSSPGGWSDSKIWDKVQADPRYVNDVIPHMIALSDRKMAGVVTLCKDWPPFGETCATCGAKG